MFHDGVLTMSRRNCCPDSCQTRTYPYGFTSHGDAAVNGRWLTPDETPDWPPSIVGQTVILDGQNYTVFQVGGSGAPQTYSLFLTSAPTVPWSYGFTTSGDCRQCGGTFSPDPAPTGWVADALVGLYITIDGVPYATITSNTTDSVTTDYYPKVSFSIPFTTWQRTGFTRNGDTLTFNVAPIGWFDNQLVGHTLMIRDGGYTVRTSGTITANTSTSVTLSGCTYPDTTGTGFSMAGGVMTPSTPPAGWVYQMWPGEYFALHDTNGVLQHTCRCSLSTTTTATLYTPPPDGDYTGWTWIINNPYPDWGFMLDIATSGQATPCRSDQSNVLTWAASYPPSWIGGEFVGCAITYDGVCGTVTANTADTLTVSRASRAFGPIPWTMMGRASGYASVSGAQIADSQQTNWRTNTMAGLPLVVRGDTYAIDSIQGMGALTLTNAVDMDFSWQLANYPAGQYYDVICSGFATTTTGVSCSTDGAKILWHAPLSIYQYSLSVTPTTTGNEPATPMMRIYFGPGGDYYFETPYIITNGTSSLVCGSQSAQLTQGVNPDGFTAPNYGICSNAAVCVWKADDGYHVLATPIGYKATGGYYGSCYPMYYPLSMELIVPTEDWETSAHRVGIGGDSGEAFTSLTMHETRGNATTAPTNCSTCSGCYVPGWTGSSMPEIQLVIIGGNLAGTYVLDYVASSSTWHVGASATCDGKWVNYIYAAIRANRDGTITLTVVAQDVTSMYPVGAWSVVQTFSPPFTDMAFSTLPCGMTSFTASII